MSMLGNRQLLTTSISILLLILANEGLIGHEGLGEEELLFAHIFNGEAVPGSAARDDDILRIRAIHIDCPESINASFVRSFLRELDTDDILERAVLASRIEKSLERLKLSQYFYQATISFTESDGEADIFVSVSDGFWWVFNIIPWDVVVAYTNMAGSGKILGTQLGLNTQGVVWIDPSFHFGPWRYSLTGLHFEGPRTRGFTDDYNLERFCFESTLGRRLSRDNIYLDVKFNLESLRSKPSYWLENNLYALSPSQLALLGMREEFDTWLSGGLVLSLGEYDFQKRGGFHGKLMLQSQQWISLIDSDNKALKLLAEGTARFDTAGAIRIYLKERFEYLPFKEQIIALPDPLRAQHKDIRFEYGSLSGDMVSLTRLSIEIDSLWSSQLSFTRLSLIPELWLDGMVIRNSVHTNDINTSFAFGMMMRGYFSIPVGRSFAIGFAINPGEGLDSSLQFVFEVK